MRARYQRTAYSSITAKGAGSDIGPTGSAPQVVEARRARGFVNPQGV